MLSTLFAGLAVAGTVANFLYTQWATGRRDVAKWRREELQKLTSNLLQLSTSRQSELGDAYEAYESNFHRLPPPREGSTSQNIWLMELIVEQIRLLDDELAVSAAAVWKAHRDADWEYRTTEVADPQSEIELLAASGLKDLHRKLIEDFRLVTGVQKRRHKWLAVLESKQVASTPDQH